MPKAKAHLFLTVTLSVPVDVDLLARDPMAGAGPALTRKSVRAVEALKADLWRAIAGAVEVQADAEGGVLLARTDMDADDAEVWLDKPRFAGDDCLVWSGDVS